MQRAFCARKGDVAVSPVVARGPAHASPRSSPPTLLTERNRRRYYYRPDRKLAEPQRQSEQTSLSVVYSCDSDSRLPLRSQPLSGRLAFSFRSASSENTRAREHAAPAVPCQPSDCVRVAYVTLIIGWRRHPRPLLSRRARCLFML